jgi:hypothetical protein
MTATNGSAKVLVKDCFRGCPGCEYQLSMISPTQRVIGCNEHDGVQHFRSDSAIALETRYKFLDRPDITEKPLHVRNFRGMSVDHTLAVVAVLGCFGIGMISFAENNIVPTILATLAGLAFLVYIKHLEDKMEV